MTLLNQLFIKNEVSDNMEPIDKSNLTEKWDKQSMIAFMAFWFGFFINIFSYSFYKESQILFLMASGLQVLGLGFMGLAAMFVISWKFDSIYLRLLFFLTIIWYLIINMRGFSFSYDHINFLLLNPLNGLTIYLVSFLVLFPKKIIFLKVLFTTVTIFSLIFIINNILFIEITLLGGGGFRQTISVVESFTHPLALPSGIILLTYMYHSRRKNLLALAVVGLAFIIGVINARRGIIFTSVIILTASFIVFVLTNKGKPLNLLMTLFLVFVLAVFARDTYVERQQTTFRQINERMFERTRSGVEEFFYRDMGTVDWIIGRGINGQYYCPGIEEAEGVFTVYRTVIETGYLQIILKGGIISLVLFLLIMLPAAFKGIFLSKNWLSKAFGIWIILQLASIYPHVINSFSPSYLMMWIAVGVCFSKDIRAKTDEEIRNILKIKYKDALS